MRNGRPQDVDGNVNLGDDEEDLITIRGTMTITNEVTLPLHCPFTASPWPSTAVHWPSHCLSTLSSHCRGPRRTRS